MKKKLGFQEIPELIPTEFFTIQKEELSDLFKPDSIRDGSSFKSFQKLGHLNGLSAGLRIDMSYGISTQDQLEVKQRQQKYSTNDPIIPPGTSLCAMIMECFQDLMLKILVIAAFISIAVGIIEEGPETGWMEGATILGAIVIIVSVASGNNYVKQLQFRKLNAQREQYDVLVTRDESVKLIKVRNLLVGDILHMQIGDVLTVDGILIEGSQLMMDQSAMTGESNLVSKRPAALIMTNKSTCFCLSGSRVMDGSGKMVVCTVGTESQLGKLKMKLQEETEPTPLQEKLEGVAEQIGIVGMVAATLTLVALWAHMGYDMIFNDKCFQCYSTFQEAMKGFMIAVTIVVVAVPEGLPLAVTISLAFSVNKMKDENILVKQLDSCEIMGGATNVCTDKTGTLTQNSMTVMALYVNDRLYSKENIRPQYLASEARMYCESSCINSSAYPKRDSMTGKWDQVGNQTECALLELAHDMGYKYQHYRPSDKILRVIPFSSFRKQMVTLYNIGSGNLRIYVKGASQILIDKCTQLLTSNGVMNINEAQLQEIKKSVIEYYANISLRTVVSAYRDIQYDSNPNDIPDEIFDSDLVLIGICGIKDPLRDSIPESIKKCKEAGIIVRMITGDNINTATSIARECGIISRNWYPDEFSFTVMEAQQFRDMTGGIVYDNPDGLTLEDKGESKVVNMQNFRVIVKELQVLARATPEDKYILVTGLRMMNEIVAVTGDGTNDAPALKKANVGFAMGVAGTEVAKDSADIILMDDNFESIITAVKWGRNVYDSIRKFIQFQLTVNVVALFMSFMGAVILRESPLNSIQMLWVNLIMDTFASLALATEGPRDDLLKRKPYQKDETIVTSMMWRNVFGQSVYQIIILTLLLFQVPQWFGIPSSFGMQEFSQKKARHFTIFFETFVFLQIFNEFNARQLQRDEINVFKGIFNNWLFWFIIIITTVVQIELSQYGGKFIKVSRLSFVQHLFCIGIGFGSIIVGVLIKLLPNWCCSNIRIFKQEEVEEKPKLDKSISALRKQTSVIISEGSERDIFQKQASYTS